MQIINISGIYVAIKSDKTLTESEIKTYQSKPKPDLTMADWSNYPDVDVALTRAINREIIKRYSKPRKPNINELSDFTSVEEQINKIKQTGKKYISAPYAIKNYDIPYSLKDSGVELKREVEFYELKYDDDKQEVYWQDENGKRVEFDGTRGESTNNTITIKEKILILNDEIDTIIAGIHGLIRRTPNKEQEILKRTSEKNRKIYQIYMHTKNNYVSSKQKRFTVAHELKHIAFNQKIKMLNPNLSLEQRLHMYEHDEKAAHIQELLKGIERFYIKNRDVNEFPSKCQWLVEELKKHTPEEQDQILHDYKYLIAESSRHWEENYGQHYKEKDEQFHHQIAQDAVNTPLSKLIGSEEDYKKVLSAAYTFDVHNPDTKRTEIKDLSAFLPNEFDISEEQKDYLKKVEEIKDQRQAYLENKGITSDILEQISKRKLPSVYNTEEKLDVRDTPQETTEQKTENEEQDQSFKEPYRKYYQTLSKQEKSLYEEDEQSPNYKATLKRTNGEELNIEATPSNQITLGAKDKNHLPKIPDYEDFNNLVKLAKQQNKTITFGKIKNAEYKARLIIACLENNVKIKNLPDLSKLQGLTPETKQKLAAYKIRLLKQMSQSREDKGEYTGLSQEENNQRNKLEQARATIREARKNNKTQNNPSYDEARAAIIARQKELKGR